MSLPDPVLCDPAHLQIFGLWWEMRGYERRPSMTELADTPAPLAKDFAFLLRRARVIQKSMG